MCKIYGVVVDWYLHCVIACVKDCILIYIYIYIYIYIFGGGREMVRLAPGTRFMACLDLLIFLFCSGIKLKT